MNNYGIWAAKRRAKLKNEKEQASSKDVDKKKKKAKSEPKIEFYPLKEEIGYYDYINWNDEGMLEIIENLYLRYKENINNEINMTLLKMPTGTGKTAVIVGVIGKLVKENPNLKPIISTTSKAVQDLGWQRTINSYNKEYPNNQIKPLILTSTDKLASITNHPQSLKKILLEVGNPINGLLVLDECHKYKNPTSKRSKGLQKLSFYPKLTLSATPLTNDIILDSVSYLVMGGYYRNKTDFENQSEINKWKDNFHKYNVYLKDGNIDIIKFPYYLIMKERLSKVIYSPNIDMKSLDMPDVRNHYISLEQDDSLVADLKSLAKAYNKRMFDGFTDYFMEIVFRVYCDEKRLEKLYDIITDERIKQPLIFYQHTEVKDKILDYLTNKGIKNIQVIKGQTKLSDIDKETNAPILIQYLAGGESIEMKNSNCSIFYENQHSYMCLVQTRGRNVRRTMKGDVLHFYMISACAIDEIIFEKLQQREEISTQLLEELVLEYNKE